MFSDEISVLIPVWNREKYIKQCIDSILNQTYKYLKIIIYDDGSTDNTIQVIEKIKDSRIKIYKNEHLGVSYSRNALLGLCDTKIACWQDSDDISNINRIEIQYKNILEHNIDYVMSNSIFFKNEAIINTQDNVIDNIHYEYPFASIMFKVDKDIRFNQVLNWGEDLIWRKDLNKKYKGISINNILYYIRIHDSRISNLKHQDPHYLNHEKYLKELINA